MNYCYLLNLLHVLFLSRDINFHYSTDIHVSSLRSFRSWHKQLIRQTACGFCIMRCGRLDRNCLRHASLALLSVYMRDSPQATRESTALQQATTVGNSKAPRWRG